jgi:hypothetical protein
MSLILVLLSSLIESLKAAQADLRSGTVTPVVFEYGADAAALVLAGHEAHISAPNERKC